MKKSDREKCEYCGTNLPLRRYKDRVVRFCSRDCKESNTNKYDKQPITPQEIHILKLLKTGQMTQAQAAKAFEFPPSRIVKLVAKSYKLLTDTQIRELYE